MEFVEELLRDVTPGVGLLIVVLYLGRLSINSFNKQQETNNRFNEQLFELLTDFKTSMKEMAATHSVDLERVANSHNQDFTKVTESYQRLETAIEKQTRIISEKLEPMKKIENLVTQASEQLKQE